MPPRSKQPAVLFMYLGRLGALGRFTYELMEAAETANRADVHFLISANNENAHALKARFPDLKMLETFSRPAPHALALGYLRARNRFAAILDDVRPTAVVNLMPHVWSPLLSSVVRSKGSRFVPVIHDAVPHPGDRTARLTRWLLRDTKGADRVVTLSAAVAQSLVAQGHTAPPHVEILFHPDLRFGSPGHARVRNPDQPLRLLFFGRIMAYKGLDLLAEAVARLKSAGVPVRLGVAGSGTIPAATANLLEQLGASVDNRWIADDEISAILANYDAVVCSHVEASQSGVAATAFGHAMPVIAMPTGGIVEQVQDRKTGLLAASVSAEALAEAIARLVWTPGLYETISAHLAATAQRRSMSAFLQQITNCALKP